MFKILFLSTVVIILINQLHAEMVNVKQDDFPVATDIRNSFPAVTLLVTQRRRPIADLARIGYLLNFKFR